MDEKELDLTGVNEIDMECNVYDDDDGFGGFTTNDVAPKKAPVIFDEPKTNEPQLAPKGEANDGREVERKTGIVLNFGDDDSEVEFNPKDLESEEVNQTKVVQMNNDGISFNEPNEEDYFNGNFKGYNAIDMECSIGEDDDFEEPKSKSKNNSSYLFDDDEEVDEVKELVDEKLKLAEESKKEADKQISQGTVEDDYYEKLKKKHAATNKKGAYNTHFHFAGDPKAEMDDFNHDMTPVAPIPNAVTAPTVGTGDSNMTVAAQGMGMGESYRKLFEDLLVITGFELSDCGNGKCCLKDKFSNQEDKVCSTINDVEAFLMPYVEDCFILPLQVETGKEFKTCKEWVDWYTPEVKKAHLEFERDIRYCDLCANHLPECKLF